MANDINIIILAGGKSSRMGQDKGLIKVKSREVVKYLINTCEQVSSRITIISNTKEYEKFGYPVINDLIGNIGPIGGLYTGLELANDDFNLLLSCDVPLVSVKLLQTILNENLEKLDGIVAMHSGKIHPLIGLYSKKLLGQINDLIVNKKFRMSGIYKLDSVMVKDLSQFPEKEFLNLNTKEDVELFKQWIDDY